MPNEIHFLSVGDVIQIQEDTIANEGGLPGLRDHGLLESAVAMPQQRFSGEYLHPGLLDMAAAYMLHLAMNHPFRDGNKRVAVMSALVFMDINGIEGLPGQVELEALTMELASGKITKIILTDWFNENIK